MREVDELAVEPFARNLPDVQPRMCQREAQQFAAGIARRANDGDSQSISHKRVRLFCGYADAPSAREIDARRGPSSVQPLAAIQPSAATFRQKSTMRSGMFTFVGAMLLRNSIV